VKIDEEFSDHNTTAQRRFRLVVCQLSTRGCILANSVSRIASSHEFSMPLQSHSMVWRWNLSGAVPVELGRGPESNGREVCSRGSDAQ